MLRIRRIYDNVLPRNKGTLAQVQEILRSRFSAVSEKEIDLLPEKLRNPLKHRFRTVLFVAESIKGKVQGFATLLHEPEIRFTYLDWIATALIRGGAGIGGALYDRVRREAAALNTEGLFYECLPDDDSRCPHSEELKQNRARLRFYERYGARPIIGTAYESPVKPDDTCMPHLVYDGLSTDKPLRKNHARQVVRAILERKYADYCPQEYVERVVTSFKDDPVRLRDFRYVKPEAVIAAVESRSDEQIALIVNDRHDIHHVNERGYVESPVRVKSILDTIEPSGLFTRIKVRPFPDKHLHSVHDTDFVSYLKRACAEVPAGKSLYPYIFPIRNKTRPPKEPSVLSGYYCIDTFTPINANAFPAARRSVDCALTAAKEILEGRRIAYALIRPPGHHAESRSFGGFCYFNNNAIAAQYLCNHGKVAILDIDYHHGNGGQEIFYRRSDVLTVSIHGHPRFAYPYFCGFEDERGDGEGEGFNLNIPLPEAIDGEKYRKALSRAITRIEQFKPQFLIIGLGLDTAKGDPTGTWSLKVKDFAENGRMIGAMGLPNVVIQEGGYRTQTLGKNALSFFSGMVEGNLQWIASRRTPPNRIHGVTMREVLEPADSERVYRLVEITGFFNPEEIDVAKELVDERLEKGDASGYHFVMADHYGRLAGYACFGLIPCTVSSYDLYWIAVHPDFQGRGLGRRLITETERRIKAAGGSRIYVDTSQRMQYASTRAFYENQGYRLESVLKDFYAPGDGKVIYCKRLI
ncbi:MAG: GNAT family N-acetyltransferase [Desulfobacterales bacterium]|nr:GNAT family N-acetyltransferase [Desulfobacterales bacterium]